MKTKLLLALVLLVSNLAWTRPRRMHGGATECRLTWKSLYTGRTGHGVWLNSYEIPWNSVNRLNEKFPVFSHDMECRPKPVQEPKDKPTGPVKFQN
jgi:hypothetical protein